MLLLVAILKDDPILIYVYIQFNSIQFNCDFTEQIVE